MIHAKKNRKAIYFILDSLLASMLLLGAIVLIYHVYNPQERNVDDTAFISQDLLSSLSQLKISELNNSFVSQEIANGNITNVNNSVLDQIGDYWAQNQSSKAEELFGIVANSSIPSISLDVTLGNSTIYSFGNYSKSDTVVFNRMISGIEQGAPLVGYSGTAYLEKIQNKKTSSYAYYGGFVGEGNITVQVSLPSDFNSSRLLSSALEIDTQGSFYLYINSVQCNDLYTGQANDTVSYFDISSCNSSLLPGWNNITIVFASPLNTSYVSGGFFRATYYTNILVGSSTPGYSRYYFPGIDGLVNLYDSFAAQGIINSLVINMSFYSPYTTFLTVGNNTLFIAPGTNYTQNVFLTIPNLTMPFETVPIRFGLTNISNITVVSGGQPADSFLVTDISGSMNNCAIYGNTTLCTYQYKPYNWWFFGWLYTSCQYNNVSCSSNACSVSPFYSGRNYALANGSTCLGSKLDLAKQADTLFVNTVLNYSLQNRIGLEDFSTSSNTATNLTSIQAQLNSTIESYTAGGSTCTCCALNKARNLLTSSLNKKFMLLLSDGDANICCASVNDTSGYYYGNCTVSEAINDAITAGQAACSQNITLYTIGFGSDMDAQGVSAMQQIACNTSLYYNATNVSQLLPIYANISNQVLLAANFSSQTINVVGNFSRTSLYPGSYIDINYTDLSDASSQNKLSLVLETPQFNGCNGSVAIPSNVNIEDAYVTSYSGVHWTDLVTINNNAVYNLSYYSDNYATLGDPFIIQIPAPLLIPGAVNNITLRTGDTPYNSSASCSPNDTLIYTALINTSTTRTTALSTATGCTWTIATASGNNITLSLPATYSGNNTCYYTPQNISYNPNDVYDSAVYSMLRQLDYLGNGKIFIDLTQNDLQIQLFTTGQVAYMWGPSLMKIEAWR